MENTWVRRNKWIFFVAPLALAVFVWLGGEVVMLLWNWLGPMLFGLRQIGFWQALGLLILCRILFGSWTGHGQSGPGWRRPSAHRWGRMTPEEREKFREKMRARCGYFEEPTGGTGEPA